jgi:predicted transcriptional regulator
MNRKSQKPLGVQVGLRVPPDLLAQVDAIAAGNFDTRTKAFHTALREFVARRKQDAPQAR